MGSSSRKIVVTIKEAGKTKQEISLGSRYEFRLLWFNGDGHTGITGKLPLVAIEPVLEDFAAEWAAGLSPESISQFESKIHEQCPSGTLLLLLQLLEQNEGRSLLENQYREQCGPEDGPVAGKIGCALRKALRLRLEK